MYVSKTFTITALIAAVLAGGTRPPGHPGRWPPTVCDSNARGPHLEARQQAALEDFAHLYLKLFDIQTAFDRWAPGQYIRHNPTVSPAQQGRQPTIDFLKATFADPTRFSVTNVSAFGGEGYGQIHFKLTLPTITFSVLDYFSFQGTCLVEHWDVMQQITGNEINPIAYF